MEYLGDNPTPSSCSSCGGTAVVLNADDNTVCEQCGAVRGSVGYDIGGRVGSLYKRVFYFNELISQFCLFEPPIPPELLGLLREARQKRAWRSLSRAKVHVLCRSVSVACDPSVPRCFWVRLPHSLSRQFQTKTGRVLRDLRKFGEKWRRIVFELDGTRPPLPEPETVEVLQRFVGSVSRAFEQIRHSPDCPCIPNCHKRFGCRHNIFDSNYILKKAFLFAVGGDRQAPAYQAVKPWLPQPEKANKRKIRQRYWNPICRKVGWSYWDTKIYL